MTAAPSIKRAASAASSRHASAAISGTSRKQAAGATQGAARAWAKATGSGAQTTASSAAGGHLATASATDTTGRTTAVVAAVGGLRSSALSSFSRSPLLLQGAESGDMTGMGTVNGGVVATQAQVTSGSWAYLFPTDPPTNRCTITWGDRNSFRLSFRLFPTALTLLGDNLFVSSPTTTTFGLRTDTSNPLKLAVLINNSTVGRISTGQMVQNTWNEIVLQVAAGDRTKLWLNGVLEVDNDISALSLISTNPGLLLIGFGGGNSYWDDIVASADPYDTTIDGQRIGPEVFPSAAGTIRQSAVASSLTSARQSSTVAASTGKAQAGPSLAKHISTASSGSLRAKAAVLSTTTRSTALARGAARTSVEQPIFLGAKATLHLAAVAANFLAARRATVIAAAATASIATDTTRRSSATASGAAASRATAVQGNTRQNTAAGSLRSRTTVASQSSRSALAKGAARSSAVLPTFLTSRATLRQSAIAANLAAARQAVGIAATKIVAVASDTTARISQTGGAAKTKATAAQGNVRQSAAVGRTGSIAVATSGATGRTTALARGSAKTNAAQPTFLTARGSLRQSAVATNLTSSRRASVLADAHTASIATDTTKRISATASAAVVTKATAAQGNVRQSTAVGRVRSAAAVISTTARSTALARGAAKTSVEQPIFLSARGRLRQSAFATSLVAARQASAIAAARTAATALDTTARISPSASGRAITKATAAQGNARQSAAIGRLGVIAVGSTGTTTRSTALAKGSAKANAAQPRFPSVKSAGKQSVVAAGTAQRAATAVARQASRATVASGQATRTAPTLYVIAGTDVVATPGPSHRATAVARGSADIGGSISSGPAARQTTLAAATLRFSVIGIQIPPEVIWLRGRRESTQLRGKYGNGSMSGQSTVTALRGRR